MRALEAAREIGLDTQVQTTVTAVNRYRLDEVARLVEQVKARAWSLALAGDEFKKVFEDIYEISRWASFDIRTGDARYRRFLTRMGEHSEPAGGARDLCTFRPRARSIRAVLCPFQPAMCATTQWAKSIITLVYSVYYVTTKRQVECRLRVTRQSMRRFAAWR
jgi:hypothetical protein